MALATEKDLAKEWGKVTEWGQAWAKARELGSRSGSVDHLV